MDSFRCIHAARLLLDHQLHGLPTSVASELAPDVRKIIQDATLLAFNQIVEQALTRDVHCVLITGDCFDSGDRGLRGPAALVRGISRLADHDIAAVLQADDPAVWASWPAGLRFPSNTHRLGAGLATSVSIAREGKLLATIAVDDRARHPSTQLPAGRTGWQIHLPAVHPLGASAQAETIDVNDECGPAQGLCADEIGPHGFTLIEIDATGEPRYTFVPVAPVRWERISIDVSIETTRDDLLQEMASRLEQTRRETCERVWLIGWDVTGTGPLCDRLDSQNSRDELLKELAELNPVPGVQIHTHALRMHSDAPVSRPIAEHGAGVDAEGVETNLAVDFAIRLEERFADPKQAITECLTGSAFAGGPWEVKIESLLADVNADEIAREARRLATHWFAVPSIADRSFAELGESSS